jgi:hypothetical protein
MKSTPKAIQNSIHWLKVVIGKSNDPKQIARANAAIEVLQAELKKINGEA